MKPLNKRVAGSITILAALALTAIAYFPLINDQTRTAKQLTPKSEMPPANNNTSAIAIQGDEVFVLQNQKLLKIDRNSLKVKQSQELTANDHAPIQPIQKPVRDTIRTVR
jgi:hypothetical protein